MLPYRLLLVLGLLLACPKLASAELRFAQPSANLGELRGGPAYQHRFEFVNDAQKSLEILDIRLGCGCLQPVLEKRLFQPGEKGSLLMHIRTMGQPDGLRSWQAHVQYRQGEKMRECILVLTATIHNEITVAPSIVAMSVETTMRQTITITDHRSIPMKVATVLASSPALRVSIQEQGKGTTKVMLEVSRTALTAARQEEMLNIYTNDPHYRHLQVPISLLKAKHAEVSATPDRVEFRGGSSGSKLVRLRAAGDRKIVVERIEVDHAAVKCTWASGPGNDATLKIMVDAQRFTSTATPASVRIQLTEPLAMTMTIAVDVQKE